MFKPPPSEKNLAEMAAAGLTPEDFDCGDVEVWPENWPAYELFRYMQTQWRAGAMGLIGLDYNTLHWKMDRMGLEPGEFDQLELDVRAMEFAALTAMSGSDT
jgi:hypothetical protein